MLIANLFAAQTPEVGGVEEAETQGGARTGGLATSALKTVTAKMLFGGLNQS